MKCGDLVKLKEDNMIVPGALTAIRFYKRLKDELGGEIMLVLAVLEPHLEKKKNKTVVVLVNGYKKVLTSGILEVVNESK